MTAGGRQGQDLTCDLPCQCPAPAHFVARPARITPTLPATACPQHSTAHLVAKLRRHARLHQHSNPSSIVVFSARQDGLGREAARRRARHGCTLRGQQAQCSMQWAAVSAVGGSGGNRGWLVSSIGQHGDHRDPCPMFCCAQTGEWRAGRTKARARTAGRAPSARSRCLMATIACQLVSRVQQGSQDAPCACLDRLHARRAGRRDHAGD